MSGLILALDWDYLRDLLGLVRWLHVFAAIMWIGITAYFVLVDNVLLPPAEPNDDGVLGERYWLHGGSFYYLRRYGSGPKRLPPDVYWHPQWYAYGTWVTGFALLVVVYYWKAGTYLVDPNVAAIGSATAIGVSVALLGVGWVVYDLLSRLLLRRNALLAIVLTVLIIGATYGLSHLFAARGVAIQIGAILGTWMAGNVVFVFSPAHRKQYAAKEAGVAVDPDVVAKSAQRGAHNTYLAMPVLFLMLSVHFAFVYSSEHRAEALIVLMLVGALLRYFFVRRQQGRKIWSIPIGAAVAVVALAVWVAPNDARTTGDAGQPSDAATMLEGQTIFASSCASCHTLADADATGTVGPNLDRAKPSHALVVERVTSGQGVMPSFQGQLSAHEIDTVASYVSAVAGR